METTFSYKKQKSLMFSDIHSDTYAPSLTTIDAKAKYLQLRHNIEPGLGITFHSFPSLLSKFHQIGWDCLVVFDNRHIYPSLLAEFYSHMSFNRSENGLLLSISTCIQGVEYIIDETLISHALHLKSSHSSLLKFNPYIYPLNLSVSACLTFKQNLANVTNQLVPPLLFDFPVPIGIDFLDAQSQFLARSVRQNIMPVRLDTDLLPADLEIMNCILHGSMPYDLPYFIMTTFEHCYHKNCMGYGLLLTQLFSHLGINLYTNQSQVVYNTNLVTHIHLPPKPLSTFKPPSLEDIDSQISITANLENMKSVNHLLLQNQNLMLTQMEELKHTVHRLQDLVHLLLANQTSFPSPFHFTTSTASVIPDLMGSIPSTDLAPLGQDFSPINLEEF